MVSVSWSTNPARDEPHPALRIVAEGARRAETPCGDGALVWRAWGQGRPLVLLHGGSGSWRHWLRNIASFARDRMVLCPDLPGLGDSDMPPGQADPDSIARILRCGLRQVIGEQSYDLVGFSLARFAPDTLRQVIRSIAGR